MKKEFYRKLSISTALASFGVDTQFFFNRKIICRILLPFFASYFIFNNRPINQLNYFNIGCHRRDIGQK